MKKSTSRETTKLERKTVEKNRRIHMKGLCFKLASLIPRQHSHEHYSNKEMLTQQDQFGLAESYINKLKERVENLKSRKEQAIKGLEEENNSNNNNDDFENIEKRLPVLELKDFGSSIEVILISGLQKKFTLSQVISIFEEEGGEVVSASSSIIEDKVFHTVHAQVKISRVGIETTRVWERLQQLIN